MEATHYAANIEFYENAIAENPDDRTLYWQYGLALLLDDQEEEAQSTWLMVLAEAEDQEDVWRSELQSVLETAAITETQTENTEAVWLIRSQIQVVLPEAIENLLQLLLLSIAHRTLSLETLDQLQLIEALHGDVTEELDQTLLFQTLKQYLTVALPHPITVELVQAIQPYIIDRRSFTDMVLAQAEVIAHVRNFANLAVDLIALLLADFPDDFELRMADCTFKQKEDADRGSLAAAQKAFAIATTRIEQVTAHCALIQDLLTKGQQDQQFHIYHDRQMQLLQELLQQPPTLDLVASYRLLISTMHLPYVADRPAVHRALQNQVVALCETNIQRHHQIDYDRFQVAHLLKQSQTAKPDRPLKVGYLCRYFYQHSVGWLARWLLKNHDPTQTEVYIYIINPQANPDVVQQQYCQLSPHVRGCPLDAIEIANQVHQDDIDILVELDSLTCQVTCEVMALKPAPIQVSWLGWDATGMRSIDYFIADPYVLPESAQADYPEQIIRLPETYIAVEGFEIGLPTLHRSQFDLPPDAVLFMTAQRGYKRHPAMMQLQLQILQQVPNGYLLIKGLADQEVIQTAFFELATAMGLSHDRLIFLPIVDSEEIHRANLAIADVILDTYPYNGATTTLEALWMERPIVTRVGEQFAARNSYTMLKNVGVEAGIAMTDAEYVEWGVRFGTDERLRQQISWQLRQAKQTAPLWNAAQFARNMESAYREMWQRFQAQVGCSNAKPNNS
jgi:predicted O-linked N-acetylglucosamine transferase (SPINDLY family)